MHKPIDSRRRRARLDRLASVRRPAALWITVLVSLAASLLAATPAAATPPEDGANQIFAVSSSQITVIDAKTMEQSTTLIGGINSTENANAVAASPDGKRIYIADGSVTVIDSETDKELKALSASGVGAQAVAVSPDGKHVYAISETMHFAEWNAETGAVERDFELDTNPHGAEKHWVACSIAVDANGTAYVGTSMPTGGSKEGMLAVNGGAESGFDYEGPRTFGTTETGPATIGAGGKPIGIAPSFEGGCNDHPFNPEASIDINEAGSGEAELVGVGPSNVTDAVADGSLIYAAGGSFEAFEPGVGTVYVANGGIGPIAIAIDQLGGEDEGNVWASTGTRGVEKYNSRLEYEGVFKPLFEEEYDAVAVGVPYHAASGLSIGAGAAVDEPGTAPESVQQSFIVSLAGTHSEPVSVEYETEDGSAKSAAHAYTPTHGTLRFEPGETRKEVQVQVDNGSGVAAMATLGYAVTLTDPQGATIETPSATGIIQVPEIKGRLTETKGEAQAGVAVSLEGHADSGQGVVREVKTNAAGYYELFADPGTYTILTETPTGPDEPQYEPVECPVESAPGRCGELPLASGVTITQDFKLLDFIVNSTSGAPVPAVSLHHGYCDTTPNSAEQTCTLRAALELTSSAEKDGGAPRSIGFDIPGGGVPVIEVTEPMADYGANIYGETQPGGRVRIAKAAGATARVGLEILGNGLTIRGLQIGGFGIQAELGDLKGPEYFGLEASAGRPLYKPTAPEWVSGVEGDRLEGDILEDPAEAVEVEALDDGARTTAHLASSLLMLDANGIQLGGRSAGTGDTIGTVRSFVSNDDVYEGDSIVTAELVGGASSTIGGTAPGAGDNVDFLHLEQSHNVVQGDTLDGVEISGGGSYDTIGGAAASPGAPPGNKIETVSIEAGVGDVIQGNSIVAHGGYFTPPAIRLSQDADHVTIGGSGGLGNDIIGSSAVFGVGVLIETASSDASVAGNKISNVATGVKIIDESVGNTVTANTIEASGLPIVLGPSFHHNQLNSRVEQPGPNHYQPYPVLLSAAEKDGGTRVKLKLEAPRGSYKINIYEQPSCGEGLVTFGASLHLIGTRSMTAGLIETEATLDVPAAEGALAATATAPDGSTSEVGPCLEIGHAADSLAKNGVGLGSTALTAEAGGGSASRTELGVAASTRLRTMLIPVCPPGSIRFCSGTVELTAHGRTVGRVSFKVAPASAGAVTLVLPSWLAKQLARGRPVALTVRITAFDGARRPHHRTTRLKARIRLAHLS